MHRMPRETKNRHVKGSLKVPFLRMHLHNNSVTLYGDDEDDHNPNCIDLKKNVMKTGRLGHACVSTRP